MKTWTMLAVTAALGCQKAEAPMCDADGDGVESVECGGPDCCDADARAFPGAPGWHSDPDACGSFDWDCSGAEEQRWGVFATSCAGIPGCLLTVDAWAFWCEPNEGALGGPCSGGAVPCGETTVKGLVTECTDTHSCSPQVSEMAQQCR